MFAVQWREWQQPYRRYPPTVPCKPYSNVSFTLHETHGWMNSLEFFYFCVWIFCAYITMYIELQDHEQQSIYWKSPSVWSIARLDNHVRLNPQANVFKLWKHFFWFCGLNQIFSKMVSESLSGLTDMTSTSVCIIFEPWMFLCRKPESDKQWSEYSLVSFDAETWATTE